MKKMHALNVSLDNNDDISLHQEWNDPNYDDPIITISKDQAGIVANWIIEAAYEGSSVDEIENKIPVNYHSQSPEPESQELTIFNNSHGMVVLKINDNNFIEMSPVMAKRTREQLSKAISESIGTMFVPDEDA